MGPLLTASVTELAAWIRAGDVGPVEVVDAHIRRIETVNPQINAVVADRFDDALREARALEASGLGDRADRPLAGVPCTIKEFFAVEGMPWTAGIRARAGTVAPRDATAVARLRSAGAIVLGVTNVPEGGLWYETHNTLYGRTHNPWDLHRTPGGSSGGEGAVVAAGGSPFGLGSDTGGSIRIPAALCGVAGHKPSGGLIPATGHFPEAPGGPDDPVMGCGPLARDARDLPLLLSVLAGPDGQDPQARPMPLGDAAAVDLRAVQVFPMPGNGRAWVRPHVARAVEQAADALAERGCQRRALDVPDLGRSFEVWAAVLSELSERYDVLCGGEDPVPVARELARFAVGRSAHTGSVLLLIALERLLDRLPGQTRELAAVARRLQTHLEAALGPSGVLIHPVVSRTAPRHRGMLFQSPFDVSLTTAFNLTAMPCTVVPIGLGPKGLPIGVQVVGRRGRDALTMAVGIALQEHFGRLAPIDPRFGRRAPLGIRLARGLPRP